jgi:hypothetical protein
VESGPGDVVAISFEADRYFIERGAGVEPKFLRSENGDEWRGASRVPDLIHDGVWWQGDEFSYDGLAWQTAEDAPASEDVVLGFLGETRVVEADGSSRDRGDLALIGPSGERRVPDLAELFSGE